MNDPDIKDDQVTLELLHAIEQRSDVSRRNLAAKLGIALALLDSYREGCTREGYVKVKNRECGGVEIAANSAPGHNLDIRGCPLQLRAIPAVHDNERSCLRGP